MKFYTISDDYLSFLRKHDNKIPNSCAPGYVNKKPYIGIVFEINEHKFLAPLTSYKPSQDKIKSSSPTAFKLHERTNPSNKLGMISLTYMIPVLEDEIIELDIGAQDPKYRRLLQMQYEYIKQNKVTVTDRAKRLYCSVLQGKPPHFARICCDFQKLIAEYQNFQMAGAEK